MDLLDITKYLAYMAMATYYILKLIKLSRQPEHSQSNNSPGIKASEICRQYEEKREKKRTTITKTTNKTSSNDNGQTVLILIAGISILVFVYKFYQLIHLLLLALAVVYFVRLFFLNRKYNFEKKTQSFMFFKGFLFLIVSVSAQVVIPEVSEISQQLPTFPLVIEDFMALFFAWWFDSAVIIFRTILGIDGSGVAFVYFYTLARLIGLMIVAKLTILGILREEPTLKELSFFEDDPTKSKWKMAGLFIVLILLFHTEIFRWLYTFIIGMN